MSNDCGAAYRRDAHLATLAAKAAVLAFGKEGKIKLFVIPTRQLKQLSAVWLPASGKYAVNHNIRPKREWLAYENAWHLLNQCESQ